MNATCPEVAIVCAWYNRADYIRDTVDSVLAQDFDRFEVVIINDGSPDPRVREILDSYDDPRLRVVHQENTGFTVAIRRAIDMTSAPYIAIQGAGDVSLPGRLRHQHDWLESNAGIGVVGCRVAVAVAGRDGIRDEKAMTFDQSARNARGQAAGAGGGGADMTLWPSQSSALWLGSERKSSALQAAADIRSPAALAWQRHVARTVNPDDGPDRSE